MPNPETEIKNIPRIQPKYQKALRKLGILTIQDLLFHFPFRYDDFSNISSISGAAQGQTTTIEGTITKSKTIRTWKRKMFVTEIQIQDDSGKIRAVWFNQPYLMDQLIEGKNIRLSGKVLDDKSGLYFSNPVWEMASRTPTNTGRLVPVYPETEGVTSRWLRWQIQMLFKSGIEIAEAIPAEILKKLHLPEIDKAINYIHFPDTLDHAILAQKRFAFEEMLLLQLKSLQVRNAWQREQAVKINFDEKLIKGFVSKLPFKLTNAQRKASFEILKDLEKNRPMNRLLNGDVGSGKTVVAAIASLQTIKAGYQVAIMAPTEVLALQHYKSFCNLFDNQDTSIGLITSAYKEINKKHKPANSLSIINNSNIIIGTHALIQENIRFNKLALVIVDEQHRFGVAQRAALQQAMQNDTKNFQRSSASSPRMSAQQVPHLLSMTATPIPRTLSLAFFGNLDISLLDEMPKDRKKIITQIVGPLERNEKYNFIRQEIKNGRQVFVILPLVEESKVLTEVKAAVAEHKRLSEEIFKDLRVGLIHGRLKPKEKEKAMQEFAEKKLDILVATAVVEVGIDIPNATVMIIEDADRFGLSQLHQFRGRIGRGEHQSYCLLFTSSDSASGKKRLKALAENSDGFKIAEIDLKLRGPGEFLGTRQSGIPDIAMENIANVRLVQIAREEAENLLKSDPELKNCPKLKEYLERFDKSVHLE